jgi:hypothetical protein
MRNLYRYTKGLTLFGDGDGDLTVGLCALTPPDP